MHFCMKTLRGMLPVYSNSVYHHHHKFIVIHSIQTVPVISHLMLHILRWGIALTAFKYNQLPGSAILLTPTNISEISYHVG